MKDATRIAIASLMLAIAAISAGCVIAGPREGYYDRDHHRYWHANAWVACGDHDDHCR